MRPEDGDWGEKMPELVLASRKPGALELKKQTIFSIYLEVTVFNSIFAYLKNKGGRPSEPEDFRCGPKFS